MSYLGDPRENAIDPENHVIWEEDNRIEERYQWGAMLLDLCDLPVDEYMKNPIIEAIENSSSSSSTVDIKTIIEKIQAVNDTINSTTTDIIEEIENSNETLENIDETVDKIYSTLNDNLTIKYATIKYSRFEEGPKETEFKNATLYGSAPKSLFFVLGDPTEEDWNEFIGGSITEDEYRKRTSNDMWIAIPSGKTIGDFEILQNGSVDVSRYFKKSTFASDGYSYYCYHRPDFVNIDYPVETEVEVLHKISLLK